MSNKYPCVYYDNGKCQKFSDDKYDSWCVLGPCEYQTRSNADYIRSITDEELAAEIVLLHTTCEVCAKNEKCGGMLGIAMCVEGVREWLKQPHKEGADG